MIKTVIVLRGLPGSGKSFLRKQIQDESGCYDVISADNYFIRPDGTYSWNYKELGVAHDWAHKNYLDSLSEDNDDTADIIIVDNTNTTFKECKFYLEEALKAGWNIIIWEPNTEWAFTPEELFKKNVHGVPLESIKKMLDRWETSEQIIGKAKEQIDFVDEVHIEIRRGFNESSKN